MVGEVFIALHDSSSKCLHLAWCESKIKTNHTQPFVDESTKVSAFFCLKKSGAATVTAATAVPNASASDYHGKKSGHH